MGQAAKIMAARWLCERAKLIELRYLENWQIGTKAFGGKGVKEIHDPGAKKRFREKGPAIGASRAPFVLRLRLPARIRPFQGSQASKGTLGDI